MKRLPLFPKATLRWMLLVGRIPLGRGFLRELRRTWKSLRAIWNPKAAHPAKAAARPLAARRGLRTWLRRFSPPRWVTLTLLVAYVGGYVVLRGMRLLSFDYPVEVLDNYMRIRNGDPTITTLGHWKPDQGNILAMGNIPVAEAPWWGLRLIDAGADARIQWAVRVYGPALFVESRFRRNADPRTQPEPRDYYSICGPLPPHRCREALRKALREQTGLKFPDLKDASGEYSYHISDGKRVEMRCWIPADAGHAVVQKLSHGRGFEGGPAADIRWLRDDAERAQGTLYAFWVPSQNEDGESRYSEGWRITLRDGGADLEFWNACSDG